MQLHYKTQHTVKLNEIAVISLSHYSPNISRAELMWWCLTVCWVLNLEILLLRMGEGMCGINQRVFASPLLTFSQDMETSLQLFMLLKPY